MTEDDAGRRIDRILRRFLPGIPLSGLYKLLRNGLVKVDGKRVKPDLHCEAGAELWIAHSIGTELLKEPSTGSSRGAISVGASDRFYGILLETPDLLFIDKRAGIPVHGPDGLDRLVPQSAASAASISFRTGPLHRLDRNTSGLIVFSRTLAGARWFTEGIRDHAFEKRYLGIVEGNISDRGETEWRDVDDEGKPMITFATPLAVSKDRAKSLVLFRIVTGKKHQIRVQSSLRGHPLSGDARYGGKPFALAGEPGYCLHAWQLWFPESRPSGVPDRVIAPLPSSFNKAALSLFGETVLAHLQKGDVYWTQDDELQ